MTAQVTLTGITGPDQDITANLLTDVKEIKFDFGHGVAFITHGAPERTTQVALTGLTTISDSISGSSHSWTIS